MSGNGDTVSAEGGALDKGVQFVQTAYQEIHRKLTEIDQDLAEVSKAWTGPAAVAFQNLMRSWGEEVTSLNKTLMGLEDALGGTEKQRTQNEEESSELIHGLAGLMGTK